MKNSKRKSTREKEAQAQKRKKNILIALMCLVLFSIGYIGTDAFLIRHERPVQLSGDEQVSGTEKNGRTGLAFSAVEVPSIALDASVMLSSVINDAQTQGYNGIVFDLKRADGTIGYASLLTTVDTFGAVSTPASKLHDSLKTLTENNLIYAARICCLRDNIVPPKASDMAVLKDGNIYKDSDGNTYLNPDSEAAYKYLKDIISECSANGVKIFILSSCTLPKEIREGHSGGFKNLSERLKNDIGGDITFLEEVRVEVDGWNAEDGEYDITGIKNDIEDFPKLKSNQVFVVETERETEDVLEQLKAAGIKRYILVSK